MDKIIITFIGIVIMTTILIFIVTFPFMWIWNAIMPDIFGVHTITFWQALGLIFLFNTLTFISSRSSSSSK